MCLFQLYKLQELWVIRLVFTAPLGSLIRNKCSFLGAPVAHAGAHHLARNAEAVNAHSTPSRPPLQRGHSLQVISSPEMGHLVKELKNPNVYQIIKTSFTTGCQIITILQEKKKKSRKNCITPFLLPMKKTDFSPISTPSPSPPLLPRFSTSAFAISQRVSLEEAEKQNSDNQRESFPISGSSSGKS